MGDICVRGYFHCLHLLFVPNKEIRSHWKQRRGEKEQLGKLLIVINFTSITWESIGWPITQLATSRNSSLNDDADALTGYDDHHAHDIEIKTKKEETTWSPHCSYCPGRTWPSQDQLHLRWFGWVGLIQVGPTKEDVVEWLEALKGDSPLCILASLKLVGHDLDHLLLLLLGDVGGVEEVPAEVCLRDLLVDILGIPRELHLQHVRDQIALRSLSNKLNLSNSDRKGWVSNLQLHKVVFHQESREILAKEISQEI